MAKKNTKMNKGGSLSIRAKLTLSVLSIAAILLVSCVISVMEYSSMSNYVSTLIAQDIESINEANKLSDMCSRYNLEILSVIGDDIAPELPEFDDEAFRTTCATLSDSQDVLYSYSAYMLTAQELENVLESDFIDSRTWFYERLQPRYQRLHQDLSTLTEQIHAELQSNSATFDRGFYRSMVPGIVAVGVGMLLLLMLYFFSLAYYVKPINRIVDSLKAYTSNDKRYTLEFDGDDELVELNEGVRELAEDNQLLRKRVAFLRERNKEEQEQQ